MLDHVFTDAIGALRDALEGALLERFAVDEHFQVDVLLGDTSWETSYGLPGEGVPPRVKADLTLDWPTWSQTAYRSWLAGDDLDDPPRIDISVVLRLQRLRDVPDPAAVLDTLPARSAPVGGEALRRANPTVETAFAPDLSPTDHAIEVAYEGAYELDETALSRPEALDAHFTDLGGWIASVLVRLGDLPFAYHAPPT